MRFFALSIAIIACSGILFMQEADGSRPPKYMGVDFCKKCHIPHFNSWSETRMSKAYELLKPGVRKEAKTAAGFDPNYDYSKEEWCLTCHTTGYGQPGGFVSYSATPHLAGVQCEMCHGPGEKYAQLMYKKKGTYTRSDYLKAGLSLPSQKNNVCVDKCHNESSPFVKSGNTFDFQNRKAIGTHRHDLGNVYMTVDLF